MQGRRFHGIDLHKRYTTINVRDSDGKEIQFITKCTDLQKYINTLDKNDFVVLESINNAFYWADQIEKQGASCIIVNPHKFKIIKESWSKTDKRDAANLSLGLWMSELRHEFKMPVVYKPGKEIRELRKLFSLYQMASDQSTQHKNSIQAVFVENGISLDKRQTYRLFKPDGDVSLLEEYDIDGAAKFSVLTSLTIMWSLLQQKEQIKNEILKMGKFFENEIKLCISIKGVTPFLVLAFLADVGDVRRFKNVRGFNAYLGVVPTVKSSGGKTQMGHITRQSRKLARTLFTQPINHIANSSDFMIEFYNNVRDRRGTGRSRVAVIRKVFNIMRCMIIYGEVYREVEKDNYEKKIREFNKILQIAA